LAPRRIPWFVWLGAALFFTAVIAVYVYGSITSPLTEPDEARYAELAREMLVSGDWITPHLNFVRYFEKPPLVYWSSAAAFAAFGVSELSARLPSLLSAIATVALTVWLAARMYGAATALIALPIISIGPLFGILAQTLVLDMTLTWLTTLAAAALWFRSYRIMYAATALAVLAKGPVAAILVGGIALIFLLLHGGWRALRAALEWRAIALGLAIALPWFIVVSWVNPDFLHVFVVEEQVNRYLWTTEHGEPIWFFLPVIPLALCPWGLMLLFDPPLLRAALAPRTWSVPTRFLVIWAGVIVLFFSLSTSKLLTYVLPAIPPLAILAARTIELGIARGRNAGLARVAWFFMVLGPLMGMCGALLPQFSTHWRVLMIAPYLLAGGPILLAMGWGTRRVLAGGRPWGALAVLAVGWLIVFAVAVSGREVANNYRNLAHAVRDAAGPNDRVALYGSFTQSIGFYSRRRVVMIGGCGELRLANRQSDFATWFWAGLPELRREWAAPGRLFLVINRNDLESFDPPLDPPPIFIAAKHKKLLVVNR
jgi:4-amino-4-deoxy-L-arabinose transferase-like glycosyltransferase